MYQYFSTKISSPGELSIIERCPCYRGVKERFDCSKFAL